MSTYGVWVILQTELKQMKSNGIKGLFFLISPFLKKANITKAHLLQLHCRQSIEQKNKTGTHIFYSSPPPQLLWENVVKEIERGENPVILLIDFYH